MDLEKLYFWSILNMLSRIRSLSFWALQSNSLLEGRREPPQTWRTYFWSKIRFFSWLLLTWGQPIVIDIEEKIKVWPSDSVGSSLWTDGSPDAWYYNSEAMPSTWKKLFKVRTFVWHFVQLYIRTKRACGFIGSGLCPPTSGKMSLSTSLPTMPSTWAYSEQENESFFIQSSDVPSAFYEKDSEVVKGFETVVVYFNDNFHLLTRVKFETFYRLDES